MCGGIFTKPQTQNDKYMMKLETILKRSLFLLLSMPLPLGTMADDVTVADVNGNELIYSYEGDDGPATFKRVKTYSSDVSKAGHIVIADAVTVDGKSHTVKYVGGSVSNRSNIVSIVFGQNIVATGGPDGSSSSAFSGCDKLTTVTLNAKLQILGTYTEGRHLDDEKMKDIVIYRQAKKVEVIAPEGFAYSLDGEIIYDSHFTVEIAEKVLDLAVPE